MELPMPATQISFAAFAASLLASAQAEPVDCTPPTVAVHAPATVVAHGSDSGGECIPFAGVWRPVRVPGGVAGLRDDAFVPWLDVNWACGGLDHPRDVPRGSHCSLDLGGRVYADGYDCRTGC